MASQEVIQALRLTIETFQLDPRKNPSHPLHHTWESLVGMFDEQLTSAIEESTPSIIKSIPQRIEFYRSLRIAILSMIKEILGKDITKDNLIETYLDNIDKLGSLLDDNLEFLPFQPQDAEDLISYLRDQQYNLNIEVDQAIKVIGKIITRINNILNVDIDDDSDTNELDEDEVISLEDPPESVEEPSQPIQPEATQSPQSDGEDDQESTDESDDNSSEADEESDLDDSPEISINDKFMDKINSNPEDEWNELENETA